jgi:methyl-accepting chemotaxis protein
MMYAMRGYGFTEAEVYIDEADDAMRSVAEHLEAASDLAARAVHLKALKGQVETAKEATAQYSALMKQTKESVLEMADLRSALDQAAAAYMENCTAFHDSQNLAFKANLEERIKKLKVATSMADLGTRVRVANFKAQAMNDMEGMQAAINLFSGVKKSTDELRVMTTKAEDLERFDAIEAAASEYVAAMGEYIQMKKGMESAAVIKGGSSKTEDAIEALRSRMHDAEVVYVAEWDEYQAEQVRKIDSDMHERLEKITLVTDITDLGNDVRIKANKGQALRSSELMEEALKNFPELEVKYNQLRKITFLASHIKNIDDTEASGKTYEDTLTKFIAVWKNAQVIAGQRAVTGGKVTEACTATIDAGIEHTMELSNEAARSLASSSTIMIIGLIAGALAGVLSAVFITRSITGPLRRVIDGLSSGAGQVASAAGQVASASQQMAEGATEQAAGLEETSSSLEEMAAMTKQSAANAQQANILAAESRKAADSGAGSMGKMSTAIHDIQQSSAQTAKIIKVIDEIAFQTNLLALNAAVEAARAGEAGKGFAVVAEEVRNLAKRSAEAAKNTATLIEESVGNAKNGVEIAAEVGSTLGEIVASVSKTAELVSEIAAASAEQSQGIDQINVAVTQMDKVTQSNAANAEESASASEELNSQAGQMNEMVAELMAMVGGQVDEKPVRQTAVTRRDIQKAHPVRMTSAARSIPFDEDLNDFNK